MKVHHLKTDSSVFEDVLSGVQTFEFRQNDRDFKVGDVLVLEEINRDGYTGRTYTASVPYILYGGGLYGVPEDYCIMAIVPREKG